MAYCSKSKANAKNQSGKNDEIKQSIQLEAVTKHQFSLFQLHQIFQENLQRKSLWLHVFLKSDNKLAYTCPYKLT